MGDRINKVSIGKFDQVVALTQQMINAGLQSQYDWAVSQGFGEPQDVVLSKFGNQGFYNTIFGAPRIIVSYAPGDLSSCSFRMLINSGELRVFASNSPADMSITSYSLRKFFLACPVNIGLAGVPKDSEEYQRIRDLMNKPGDYSIKQLLVDFASAQTQVLDPTGTDFGVWTTSDWILKDDSVSVPPEDAEPTADYWRPPGWAEGEPRKLEGDILANLKACFSYALGSAMTKAAAGQLGFTASTTDIDSTGHEPSFVPSDVRFQTYPYRDSNGQTETGLDGNGRLNYVLYLEMTDNHTPPSGDGEFLPADNGNWTNGTDPSTQGIEEFGTYILSRKNFLETWLLPKMNKLNRMMSASYYSVEMHFHGNLIEWWYSRDNAYAMTHAASMPSEIQIMILTAGVSGLLPDPGQGAWCYYQWNSPEPWEHHDEDWNNKCYSFAKANSASRLSIVPGNNTLTLEGFTWLNFGFVVSAPLTPDEYQTNRTTVTWKVQFTMAEVTDGGLAIQISEPEIQTHWESVVTDWKIAGTDQRADIKGTIDAAFDEARTNFINLTHEIKNALEGNERFYFPSRGRFYFKDPLFGHNADLVVKCAYNGNETGVTNPDTDNHRDISNPAPFKKVKGIPFGGGGGGKREGGHKKDTA